MRSAFTIIAAVVVFHYHAFSQQFFSLRPTTAIDLGAAATSEYNTCANSNAGNSLGAINVSGVVTPLNTTTNRLAKIELQLDPSCGGNFRDLWFVLKKMPSGPCFVFYDGSSVPTTNISSSAGVQTINLTDNTTCGADLSVPRFTSAQNLSKTTTGNTGFYKAGCHTCNDGNAPDVTLDNQRTQSDASNPATLTSRFNNIDPNGEWRVFSLYTGLSTSAPCFKSATIFFGDPQAADRKPDGDNCATAIEWTGTPFCATSNGKSGSSLMPGSCIPNTNFTTPIKIGGEICEWNFANNNDVWIKYTAIKAGYVCLNISGLKIDQQSILVTDANADNDNNPCTQLNSLKSCLLTANGGTNDPYWDVVSCPRDLSYNATSGSPYNQQHCFTAEQGKTYYLIVDGTDGTESPFYVSGLRGTSDVTLDNGILDLKGNILSSGNLLQWISNIDPEAVMFYELERSFDNQTYHALYRHPINTYEKKEYSYLDQLHLAGNNYYRIKVMFNDGTYMYSSVVVLKSKSNHSVTAYPNPVVNTLNLSAVSKKMHGIKVFNSHGQIVFTESLSGQLSLQIPTQTWVKGQYIVVVTDQVGHTERIKVLK